MHRRALHSLFCSFCEISTIRLKSSLSLRISLSQITTAGSRAKNGNEIETIFESSSSSSLSHRMRMSTKDFAICACLHDIQFIARHDRPEDARMKRTDRINQSSRAARRLTRETLGLSLTFSLPPSLLCSFPSHRSISFSIAF